MTSHSAVLGNVVTNETNVRGVAQKVALGEVDAGIVYETDAAAGQYADSIRVLEIPLQFNPAAQYPIAALSTSQQLETAPGVRRVRAGRHGPGHPAGVWFRASGQRLLPLRPKSHHVARIRRGCRDRLRATLIGAVTWPATGTA